MATAALKSNMLNGVDSPREIETILRRIESEKYPLLEKVNILLLYQAMFRNEDLLRRSSELKVEYRAEYSFTLAVRCLIHWRATKMGSFTCSFISAISNGVV